MSQIIRRPPRPADVLYENLFQSRPEPETLQEISKGVSACRTNASRLLSDAQYLAKSDRFSSARFLLTTAREEIAKSYILVDTCRLNFQKHESVLKHLCSAFYDHIRKHAYLEVTNFGDVRSLEHAREIWDCEVVRWWPAGSPEDGEPDMPHDSYFDRELPLYVDYGDYDQCWLVPKDEQQRIYFIEMFGETSISKVEKIVESWETADLQGLCSPQVLGILNAHFRKHYFHEGKNRADIARLYRNTAEAVSREIDVTADQFLASELVQWPLYDFLC